MQYLNQIKLPDSSDAYHVGYNGNTWSSESSDSEQWWKISSLQDGLYLLKVSNKNDQSNTIVFEYIDKIPYIISAPMIKAENNISIKYNTSELYIQAKNIILTGLIFKEQNSFSEPIIGKDEEQDNVNSKAISLSYPIQHASVGYGTGQPSADAPYTIYIQTGVTING